MENKIKKVIEEKINPFVALHNGKCELLDYTDGIATVSLTGGCAGCPSARITLYNGVKPILQEEIPEIQDVVLGD